jgi:hypothetical protein
MRTTFLKVLAFAAMVGCKKETPPNEQEHEAITTISLIMNAGAVRDTFQFDDPDGDGGLPPNRLDTIRLSLNTSYQVEIKLFNKTKNPVEELTPVIKQQAISHEFFYLPEQLSLLVTKTDLDNVGLPLGIMSVWQTSAPDTGFVRIRLMHKPLLKGPQDGPEKGHADLDVKFPIQVN